MAASKPQAQTEELKPSALLVALRLIPAFLCVIMLGAHFLRAGIKPMFLACLLFPSVWLARRNWARLVTMFVLGAASIVWVLTSLQLVMFRQMKDAPWLRLALILGAVTLFNLLAIGLLTGERMRTFFRVEGGRTGQDPQAKAGDASSSEP